jgi:hypothetical protein
MNRGLRVAGVALWAYLVLGQGQIVCAQVAVASDEKKPGTQPANSRVESLVAQLASDDQNLRDAAENELLGLGEAVSSTLRAMLAQQLQEEARLSIERILNRIDDAAAIQPTGITLELENATVHEAFEQVGRQTTARFEMLIGDAAALPKASIRLQNAPFWRAVREIARQFGVRCDVVDGRYQVALSAEPTGLWCHAGGVSVVLTNANFNASLRFGQDDAARSGNLSLSGHVLPDPKLRLSGFVRTEITEAVDDTGKDLRSPTANAEAAQVAEMMARQEMNMMRMEAMRMGAGRVGINRKPGPSVSIRLQPPSAKATQIARLAGKIRTQVADDFETIEIDNPFESSPKSLRIGNSDIIVSPLRREGPAFLVDVTINTSIPRMPMEATMNVPPEMPVIERDLRLVSPDGNSYPPINTQVLTGTELGAVVRKNTYSFSAEADQKPLPRPAKIICRIPASTREAEFAFVFEGVPLPN